MRTKKIQYVINKIEIIQSHLPKYFHKQIRKQLFNIMLPNLKYKYNNQTGGTLQKELLQVYKGYEFRTFIDKTDNDIMITIRTHENEPSDCAIAIIDLTDRHAIIQGLSYYHNCTKPYIEPGQGGGSIVLRYLLGIIKVNRKTFGVDRIILEDNARKDCNNCDKKIKLSDLYFLMNGNTWYGKYGFRPFDKNDQIPHVNRIKKYERNQKIINKTKTKDVPLIKYMNDAIEELNIKNIDMEKLGPKIKSLENKPLSLVIKTLMKTYDDFCCIFAHIIDKIYNRLNLHKFFGESFYVDIDNILL